MGYFATMQSTCSGVVSNRAFSDLSVPYTRSFSVRPRIRQTAYPRFASTIVGRRYYSPSLHTWISRDPIGERKSPNYALYAAYHNAPIYRIDSLGLFVEVRPMVDGPYVTDLFNFLCPAGNFVWNSPFIASENCCPIPEEPRTSCECLCSVVQYDTRHFTIYVEASADVGFLTELVNVPGSGLQTIPFPDNFPHTVMTSDPDIIIPPESGDAFSYGEFDVGGLHMAAPNWRILAHELCGHAWAGTTYLPPQTSGWRPDHDSTIWIENLIATEHLAVERGTFGSPRQGESTWQLVGDPDYFYWNLDPARPFPTVGVWIGPP